MKPDEIKRYRLCGEEYKDAFMATNNDWSVPSDEHDYVLAADHDRVVADYKRAMDNLIHTLHVEQDRNQALTDELTVLRGPGNATQRQLDEATKPLHARIAALTETVEKYQACRVHDVDEKNYLRDQLSATQALLAEACAALKQVVYYIDPGYGSRCESAYLNALHFLAKTSPGVDSSQDDASAEHR